MRALASARGASGSLTLAGARAHLVRGAKRSLRSRGAVGFEHDSYGGVVGAIVATSALVSRPGTSLTERSAMDTPESMREELGAWNGGQGIELESWVGCAGNFGLAVGYAAILWPQFVEFEGYILRAGFSEQSLRGFEAQVNGNRRYVEAVMNHLHIADIQYYGCPDLTRDKVLLLGKVLGEMYEAKLAWQFPGRPCRVSFFTPEDESDLIAYEITFWQIAHESSSD